MFKQVTCVVTLLLCHTVSCSDIIDLVCETDVECETFKSTAVNSTCAEGHCQCVELESGNRTTCKPVVTKASNQIGGQCPCISSNSYCNEKTQLCACKEGFLPSRGGKKCISKSVALGNPCEIDEQCIRNDHFSHCDDVHHNCSCSNHFLMFKDTCHSIIAAGDTPCERDTDCSNRTENSICQEKQCICDKGFVANAENSTCLPVVQYEQVCIDSNQCIAQLGEGSVCSEGKCVCNELYFPLPVHAHENATAEHKVHVVCRRKVNHGASCNDDKECYQFHRGPHEQTMECFMSECVCSQNYSEKDGVCVSQSGASTAYISSVMSFILLVLALYTK